MATPPNDDSRMLFKLLSDGEWHDYEDIRDRLAATVPPGRALRKYQERVDYTRRDSDGRYEQLKSEDDQIYYGQRAVAQATITSWKSRGIMVHNSAGLKQIRIKPGFRSWGLDVTVPAVEADQEDAQDPAGGPEKPQDAEGSPDPPARGSEPLRAAQQAPEPGLDDEDEDEDEVPFYAGPIRPLTEPLENLPRRRITLPEEPHPEDLPDEGPALETLARQPRHYARDPQVTPLGLPSLPWICPRCDKQNTSPTCERCGITPVYGKDALASQPPAQPRAQPPAAPVSQPPAGAPLEGVPAEDYSWPKLRAVTEKEVHRRCDECGLLVSDEAKHSDWHGRFIARDSVPHYPEGTVFTDSELQSVLGHVLGKQLDDFQAGMERYLSAQFAQLEGIIEAKKPTQRRWRNQR